MDINKALSKLSELEKEKARMELLVQQLREQKKGILAEMEKEGVTPDTLDGEIAKLEADIQAKFAAIGD